MCDVTAIIPTYNRSRLLPRAIDSILKQTRPPEQVIVVDDGSTDDTREVCARYSKKIDYMRQDNTGASGARNCGLALARHSWIAFLDSDDYWEPCHLERIAAAIRETRSEAVVYFCDMKMPEDEGGDTLWQRVGFRSMQPHHLVRDATAWALMKRQPMMLQAAVIAKDALVGTGGFDARFKLSHDTHIFCRLAIGRPACAVAGVGCVQTSDDMSLLRLSNGIPLDSVDKAREACAIWCEALRDAPMLSPMFRRLVRFNAAGSYWQVGMSLIRSGAYGQGLRLLLRASAIDPRFALWHLRHGTGRGYEEMLRAQCPRAMDDSETPVQTESTGQLSHAWRRGPAV